MVSLDDDSFEWSQRCPNFSLWVREQIGQAGRPTVQDTPTRSLIATIMARQQSQEGYDWNGEVQDCLMCLLANDLV